MRKFHVGKDQTIKPCRATKRPCSLGSHFTSREEGEAHLRAQAEEERKRVLNVLKRNPWVLTTSQVRNLATVRDYAKKAWENCDEEYRKAMDALDWTAPDAGERFETLCNEHDKRQKELREEYEARQEEVEMALEPLTTGCCGSDNSGETPYNLCKTCGEVVDEGGYALGACSYSPTDDECSDCGYVACDGSC